LTNYSAATKAAIRKKYICVHIYNYRANRSLWIFSIILLHGQDRTVKKVTRW